MEAYSDLTIGELPDANRGDLTFQCLLRMDMKKVQARFDPAYIALEDGNDRITDSEYCMSADQGWHEPYLKTPAVISVIWDSPPSNV
nr:hypothetical protein CFP56_55960 [Quercus suber]